MDLSYSARLMRPFLSLLPTYPGFPVEALQPLQALDLDGKIPIARSHALLEAAIAATGDPHLGLKAGRSVSVGDAGVTDYAISTAATVGDGVQIAIRYSRLVNEALDVRLDLEGDYALIRMESRVLLPRVAEDFMMSASFVNHIKWPLRAARELECWLTHPAPADVSEYEKTFAPARLRFAARCGGWRFERAVLELPLESADEKLRSVVRQLAERLLADLPAADTVTDRLRRVIARELSHGDPSSTRAAKLLQMSQRTLVRRLELEGTSFRDVLDDLRRRLAFEYLERPELAISEVAFLLGFSQAAAFHRAFKRWTGTTPLEHRRRNGASAP